MTDGLKLPSRKRSALGVGSETTVTVAESFSGSRSKVEVETTAVLEYVPAALASTRTLICAVRAASSVPRLATSLLLASTETVPWVDVALTNV